jgi:hypothetical protein
MPPLNCATPAPVSSAEIVHNPAPSTVVILAFTVIGDVVGPQFAVNV